MTTDQQARPVAVTTPAEREILVERVFDAPRDLVFATFHDPALIPEWWGEGTTVDKMDVRNGGDWRFVSKGEGYETAFRGTFREVTPPERSVRTFEWEGMPGHVLVESTEFVDLGDQTRVVTTMLFHTTEERDGLLATGMEQGVNQTYARMDQLLARLASK